jgi:hypothetical protein
MDVKFVALGLLKRVLIKNYFRLSLGFIVLITDLIRRAIITAPQEIS